MTESNGESAPLEEGRTDWPLELRPNGSLVYDGVVVGSLRMVTLPTKNAAEPLDGGPELTLNLGWLRAAGLRIAIQGDPDRDHTRSGLVLKR